MINLRKIYKKIKIGNGKYVNATHIGTKIGEFMQNNLRKKIRISDVLLVPEIYCNLISAKKLMLKGCKISGQENVISVEKNGLKFLFDHQIKSGQGQLLGMKILPEKKINSSTQKEFAGQNKVNTKCDHDILGLPGDNFTAPTAEKLNLKVIFK